METDVQMKHPVFKQTATKKSGAAKSIAYALAGAAAAFGVFAFSGYNIVCYAIPDTVYLSVEESSISSYHTWRMALTTLGTVLSTALFGLVADSVSPTVLAVCGTVSVFFCCLAYHRVLGNAKRPGADAS